MRLDKYLAQSGIGTRSQVKEYIRAGQVQVNGIREKHADRKIHAETDDIVCREKSVTFRERVYYMLNKPSGCVSVTQDERYMTVLDLLGKDRRKDLFPVGRLDRDTEGLLLLTNDGALAHRLLSPRNHVPKTYQALLARDLTSGQIDLLENGVDIGEEKLTLPSVFTWKDRQKKEAFLTITEGKFHQVKRMFEAVGNQVLSLKRLSMGSLVLDESLSPGEYRPLYEKELEELLD